MAKLEVRYTINGRKYEAYIEPNRTLLEVVRDELRLTGSKEGCGTGDCGACSMIVDGKLVTRQRLEGGEIVQLGETRVQFFMS